MLLVGLKLGFIYPDSVGNFHPMSIFNFLSLPKKPFYSLSLPNVIALLSVWTLDPLPTCIEISRDNTGWFWLTLVLVYSDRMCKLEPLHTPSPSFWSSVIPVQDLQLCCEKPADRVAEDGAEYKHSLFSFLQEAAWKHSELASHVISQLRPLPNVPQLFWNHSGDWALEILLRQTQFSQTQIPPVL